MGRAGATPTNGTRRRAGDRDHRLQQHQQCIHILYYTIPEYYSRGYNILHCSNRVATCNPCQRVCCCTLAGSHGLAATDMPLLLSMVAAGKLQPEKLVERILSTIRKPLLCLSPAGVLCIFCYVPDIIHVVLCYVIFLLIRIIASEISLSMLRLHCPLRFPTAQFLGASRFVWVPNPLLLPPFAVARRFRVGTASLCNSWINN